MRTGGVCGLPLPEVIIFSLKLEQKEMRLEPSPSPDELRILTLRGLAAFAARTARRGTDVLRGHLPDDVIERPIMIVQRLATSSQTDRSHTVLICEAAADVLRALDARVPLRAAPAELNLTNLADVVLGIYEAIEYLSHPTKGTKSLESYARGLKNASKIAERTIAYSSEPTVTAKIIHQDYCELLRISGEHTGVTLGLPVDPSYFALS